MVVTLDLHSTVLRPESVYLIQKCLVFHDDSGIAVRLDKGSRCSEIRYHEPDLPFADAGDVLHRIDITDDVPYGQFVDHVLDV